MVSVNGAFKPVYLRENLVTGEVEGAFEPDDFEALTHGYGCTACFADYHGVLLPRCPICGAETQPRVVGQWWTDYPTFKP